MNEILLIDKPRDWTSFDVIAKIRGAAIKKGEKRIKVGHTGTLDPFATGLLIVLLGDETKNQERFMKLSKEYEASLKLGYESSTGDPEGIIKKVKNCDTGIVDEKMISKVLDKFIGEISQTPPKYSAVKIDGQRAYKLAREGKDFKLKSRRINIYEIEILSFSYPELILRVSCSSGTYVRALAEDIGKKLGCGAYLTALRRTKIGKYNIDDAKTIDNIMDKLKKEKK